MNGTPGQPAGDLSLPPDAIVVKVFARTDVGQLREHNEDDFLVADLTRKLRTLMPDVQTHVLGPRGSLFVVCDGMGGAAAGEVASRTAVDTIYEHMAADEAPPDELGLVGWLDHSIIEAGQRIYAMARSDQERRGMGTTCTSALLFRGRLFVAQVGDSRCYLLRNGVMQQVSRDQSLLTQLIEAGQVRPEDADNFEHSNIILQALGTTEMVNTDVTWQDLRQGDTFLLCSDGLAGMVTDADIREIVLASPDPLAACRALTDRANQNGGEDNITVVVATVGGPGLPPADPNEPIQFARYPKPRPTLFDKVPYSIPNQLFADGGSAVPLNPETPLGAVNVGGIVAEAQAQTQATPVPAPPVSVPPPAAAPLDPAAAPAPPASSPSVPTPARVLEWSDDETNGYRPSAPPSRRNGLLAWGVVAFLALALIIGVLVYRGLGGDDGAAAKAPDAAAPADEGSPRGSPPAAGKTVPDLRPGLMPRALPSPARVPPNLRPRLPPGSAGTP